MLGLCRDSGLVNTECWEDVDSLASPYTSCLATPELHFFFFKVSKLGNLSISTLKRGRHEHSL